MSWLSSGVCSTFGKCAVVKYIVHSVHRVHRSLSLPPSPAQGTPQFIEENNDDNYCYYLFNWPTSNICPVPPIPFDPGWIVIIM